MNRNVAQRRALHLLQRSGITRRVAAAASAIGRAAKAL
jgi:hypothetical protein